MRQTHDGQQVADVEAVRRRIKPAVQRKQRSIQQGAQVLMGDLVHKAPPRKFLKKRHGLSPPSFAAKALTPRMKD
jgi:hypothetical protein